MGGLHCRAWPLKELRVTLPLLPLVFLEKVGVVAITITGWSEEWQCGDTGHLKYLLLCLSLKQKLLGPILLSTFNQFSVYSSDQA